MPLTLGNRRPHTARLYKNLVAIAVSFVEWLPAYENKCEAAKLKEAEKKDFANAVRVMTCKYDNLFKTSFPYSAGLHQAPTDGKDHPEWHFHMHFYPPLLRSSSIKKFMVGYEMLAEPQRDITPEYSAGLLKELSAVHY